MTTQTPQLPAAQQPPDKLTVLIRDDLPREVKRIAGQDATLEQLKSEIVHTVCSLLGDLGMSVVEFRNWAVRSQHEHSDHLDDHEQRLTILEESVFSAGTQLSQEDADMFSKVVAAAEALAEQGVEQTSSSEGKAKLQEVLDLCKQATERIEETTISVDDDDGDGEEDDGSSADETEVVATASTPGQSAPLV
jgi:hypothetical protein